MTIFDAIRRFLGKKDRDIRTEIPVSELPSVETVRGVTTVRIETPSKRRLRLNRKRNKMARRSRKLNRQKHGYNG